MQHEQILPFFAKFIESELGIVYAEHNYFQLQNRLEDIAKLMGLSGVEKLHEQSQGGIGGAFKQLLLDVATNNETSFFRDARVFRAVEQTVLPAMQSRRPPNETMRIWSAASSTGQEALSIAIMIEEWNKTQNQKIPYAITGTDISERVLSRAKEAIYSQLEIQRGMPATHLIRYFKKDPHDRWQASFELTQKIEYFKLNLKEPFGFPRPFDLIFCRNVLIYQSVENKIAILKKVTQNLNPGGFLVLGSGESLLGLSDDYDQTESQGAVVYRRKGHKI